MLYKLNRYYTWILPEKCYLNALSNLNSIILKIAEIDHSKYTERIRGQSQWWLNPAWGRWERKVFLTNGLKITGNTEIKSTSLHVRLILVVLKDSIPWWMRKRIMGTFLITNNNTKKNIPWLHRPSDAVLNGSRIISMACNNLVCSSWKETNVIMNNKKTAPPPPRKLTQYRKLPDPAIFRKLFK